MMPGAPCPRARPRPRNASCATMYCTKTEVYSWRVSRELKSELEEEARRRNLSLSAMLDLAVTEWLNRRTDAVCDDEEQRRLQAVAAKYAGSIAGGDPTRSANVSR